jgi:putative hydrolase of HD superfamily
MDLKRLNKQMEFIIEIDKLKSIFRQNLIVDSSRSENDTEHSWHLYSYDGYNFIRIF